MKRKMLALLLSLTMCVVILTPAASAVKFGDVSGVPTGFWAIFTPYEDALSGSDNAKIASTGMAVIEYWLDGASAETRAAEWIKDVNAHGYEINSVWSTSRKVAEKYEAMGDVANSIKVNKISLAFVDVYKALLPSIGGNPDDMEFARTEIKSKLAAYDVTIELYAELRDGSGTTSYTGAKHEPKTGAYFGEPPAGGMVTSGSQKPSSTLIYVLYETEDMEARVENDLIANETQNGYKRSDYSAVQIAWNFKDEGATLAGVPGDTAKITKAAEYLASLKLPVLLRVGAEMNVWETAAKPAEYIAAFRAVADIMHKTAPNVAMVWSVNSISAAGLTYDMFYPGDSYVDWVGISLYTSRYFLGNPGTTDSAAAIYGTGKYANPVSYISELVSLYGSRKPIVIAEGAVSLKNNSNNEDLTAWAAPRMRQVYAYIPMLFPQVKAIYWFNFDSGATQRWDFAASASAKTLYGQLTSSDYFIGKGESSSPITYKKLGTVTMPTSSVTLLTYAPYFTMDSVTVQYKLDGSVIASGSDIPYRTALDFTKVSDGAHKLTIAVLSGGSQLTSKDYNLQKSGASVTISTGAISAVPQTITATPTSSAVLVNGKNVAFEAYNIGGANYFKLRDLAFTLNGTEKQFSVAWDNTANAIRLGTGGAYAAAGGEMSITGGGNQAAVPTSSTVIIDGKTVAFEAYNIGGANYFKLRDIGTAFDFGVEWDGTRNTIVIDTGKGYSTN